MDDYVVDEIERNDESFIFVVQTSGGHITGLRLYPTKISHIQASLAGPHDASASQRECRGSALASARMPGG